MIGCIGYIPKEEIAQSRLRRLDRENGKMSGRSGNRKSRTARFGVSSMEVVEEESSSSRQKKLVEFMPLNLELVRWRRFGVTSIDMHAL